MHVYAICTCQAQNHIFTFQFKEDQDDVIEDVADERSQSSVGAMVRQIVLLGFHCLPCLDLCLVNSITLDHPNPIFHLLGLCTICTVNCSEV